jgi:2-dehydro-3-deoxyphosphooctonate aldolase (KDO 8-P synthase)
MLASSRFAAAGIEFGNDRPAVVIGGVNVLENTDISLRVGEAFRSATAEIGVPYLFKASFDKANRSSVDSYRGPGLDAGLAMLARVKRDLGVPVVTDVHAPEQCAPVAEVADVLQIPAFLVRQTDLLAAAAATGRPLHLKKSQMMAPADMRAVAEKCGKLGATRVMLCERGTFFGYHRLVVDVLGLAEMCRYGLPTTLDVTHALQLPGSEGSATGGRGEYARQLAMAGAALGLAGIFIEAHPAPERAPCDGASATRLADVPGLLRAVKRIDDFVKSQGA